MNPAALALFSALACLGQHALGHPVRYDQRQEGDVNVRTDVEDVVFVVVPPQDLVAAGMGIVAATAADFLRKNYGNVGPERWPQRTPPKLGFVPLEKSPYKIDLEKAGIQVKKIQHAGDPNRYNFHESKNPTKSAPEIKAPSTSTQFPEKATTEMMAEVAAEVQSTTENKTVKKDLKPEEPKKAAAGEEKKKGEKAAAAALAETAKKAQATKAKTEENPAEEPPKIIGEGTKADSDPTSIFKREGCGPDAFRDGSGMCVFKKPETLPK